jgi:hypothetical protein
MASVVVIIMVIFLGFYALSLMLIRTKEFKTYKQSNNFFEFRQNSLRMAYDDLPTNDFLLNKLGAGYYLRFLIPALMISIIAIMFLGPLLTNCYYGIFLGTIIAGAYCLRIFFHQAQIFREGLLIQTENILRQIRNQLSSGASLDYALNLVKNQTQDLKQDLIKFLQTVESNFYEAFPQWLIMLKNRYSLNELSDSAQILSLELKYTNNQEQAFLTAITAISNRITLNKKTQNLISLTFLSLDFMIIAFLAVIFYVIPSFALDIEPSWWESPRRILVIFVSGLGLWACYLITIFIALRRLA